MSACLLPLPVSRPRTPRSLLAGIRGASRAAQYVLCLDDDVLLHRGLLAALVRDMEADATLFMATGEQRGGGCEGLLLWGWVAGWVVDSGSCFFDCNSCPERHANISVLPVPLPPICPPTCPPPQATPLTCRARARACCPTAPSPTTCPSSCPSPSSSAPSLCGAAACCSVRRRCAATPAASCGCVCRCRPARLPFASAALLFSASRSYRRPLTAPSLPAASQPPFPHSASPPLPHASPR